MEPQRGFSLIEIVVGMLILSAVTVAVLPPLTHDLILGNVLWERRLALKVVESKLEEACDLVRTGAGFDTLVTTTSTALLPQELPNATWTRQVDCLDGTLALATCPTDLKRLWVQVDWTSRRAMSERSADYLVSRVGVCGAGLP